MASLFGIRALIPGTL